MRAFCRVNETCGPQIASSARNPVRVIYEWDLCWEGAKGDAVWVEMVATPSGE